MRLGRTHHGGKSVSGDLPFWGRPAGGFFLLVVLSLRALWALILARWAKGYCPTGNFSDAIILPYGQLFFSKILQSWVGTHDLQTGCD